MRSRSSLFARAALGVALLVAVPVAAEVDPGELEIRISELEDKVRRLEALLEKQADRVESCAQAEEMEAALASCARIDDVEVAIADATQSPTLNAETQIKVGGYVKMDAILSQSSRAPIRGVGEDLFIPSTIATAGEPGDPRLNLHARETRFWLKSFTPTERGDITTHFEIDFLLGQQGDERVGNSFSPRIRHASLNWGRWTVGQTWTNFFNVSTLPDYLDFIGPVGTIFARQPQIRYTVPRADGSWSVSLENPETTLTPHLGGSRIDADDDSLPDLTVRRDWSGDWGNVSVAALVRQLKIDDGVFDDSATGAALGVAGRFKVGERDDFRWQINAGNALGRYHGLNAFNAGVLDADGGIELTPQYGIFAAHRHFWSDRLYSSFGASLARADNDTALSGIAVPESYRSAHANIIWSPVRRMTLGAEYILGRRVDESGDDGILKRLQLSAKYVY